MMRRRAKRSYGQNVFPGVYLHRKGQNSVLYIRWQDPRTGKTEGPRSTKTYDLKEWGKIAKQIHSICSQVLFDDPPEGTDDIVLQILGIEAPSKRDHRTLNEGWKATAEELIKASLKNKEIERLWTEGSGLEQFFKGVERQLKETNDLRRQLSAAQAEANRWKAKAVAYEVRAVAQGQALIEATEKPFLEALWEWDMQNRRKSGPDAKWPKTKHNYIVAIARHAWEDKHHGEPGMVYEEERDMEDLVLSDLTDERLKGAFLALMDRTDDDGSVRQQVHCLNSFMRGNIGSYWKSEPLITIQKSLKSEDEPLTPNDWLEKKEAMALITNLGDYWKDAALLQYEMGWRGEELHFLLTSGWSPKESTLQVLKIEHEGKVIRKGKNKKAYRAVRATPVAKRIIERLAQKNPLGPLFPKTEEAGSEVHWSRSRASAFEREFRIWTATRWNNMYRDALVGGARKAGIPESKFIGGRILRHTCGREIVLKNGFADAAAILRNSITIVQRHYADLLPTDVSPER